MPLAITLLHSVTAKGMCPTTDTISQHQVTFSIWMDVAVHSNLPALYVLGPFDGFASWKIYSVQSMEDLGSESYLLQDRG